MEKYSSVIIKRQDRDEFVENLAILNSAFCNLDFKEIINSSNIKSEVKLDFVLSLCKCKKQEFINFIKLLMLNKNINKIPEIYVNLIKNISLEEGIYTATIFTKNKLDDKELISYENKLSNRFGKNIKLSNQLSVSNEVKIYIEDLGYEIVVSNDKLKQKLKDYIIKVI